MLVQRKQFSAPLSNGLTAENYDLFVTNNGAAAFLEMEELGGGDVDFFLNGQNYTLDCTTGAGSGGRAQAALILGTDSAPILNYFYLEIVAGTPTLVVRTNPGQPDAAFIGAATVPSLAEVIARGVYNMDNFSEVESFNSRGLMARTAFKARINGVTWASGVEPTLTITPVAGANDSLDLSITAGSVYQLSIENTPAWTLSTDGAYVVNDPTTPYQRITDLNEITQLATGAAITNDRYNLVVWGALDDATGNLKVFINSPIGRYGNDAQAINDRNNTAVTSAPREFLTSAFLIARLPLRRQTAAGGTYTDLGIVDLRGAPLGFNLGGASSSDPVFSDATFGIFDNLDDTKFIRFDAENISSGQQRFITAADWDIDFRQYNTQRQTLAPTGTTQTIDWNNGSLVTLDVSGATGDVTLTLDNPLDTTYMVTVVQGATPRNIIFPAGTLQVSGGGNTFTPSGANQVDKIALEYLSDRTEYHISATNNYA